MPSPAFRQAYHVNKVFFQCAYRILPFSYYPCIGPKAAGKMKPLGQGFPINRKVCLGSGGSSKVQPGMEITTLCTNIQYEGERTFLKILEQLSR
jgi:hypothetical protein